MNQISGGCDHVGPVEIFQMAEEYLRGKDVSPEKWSGFRFGFGENVSGQKHKSVYTEVERRGTEWIVTAIERRPDPIAPEDAGLTVRSPAA